ncbi:MAG: hypothetical protein PHF74_00905 [Dehalococcoidales bacterium]|nr:hypothetical protein [Dehalococcoidales bacterium]
MHRLFLTAGIVVSVLALIFFSHCLKDADGNTDIEIKPAPIHEVDIRIAESYPEQVFVYVKGGLPDGCTSLKDITMEKDGNIINITVTVQRPKDAICIQVYSFFEETVNLGSNFIRGQNYIVNVNGTIAEFTYPL